MQGTVVAVHSGGLYRVQCDAGHEVLAQLSGRMRRFRIKVVPGDRVTVGVSPYRSGAAASSPSGPASRKTFEFQYNRSKTAPRRKTGRATFVVRPFARQAPDVTERRPSGHPPALTPIDCETTPVPFTSLAIDPRLLEGVRDLGFVETRPVQSAVIPLALHGADLIACAETGTGKTCAFVLPTLQWLLTEARGSRLGARTRRRSPDSSPQSPDRSLQVLSPSPQPPVRSKPRPDSRADARARGADRGRDPRPRLPHVDHQRRGLRRRRNGRTGARAPRRRRHHRRHARTAHGPHAPAERRPRRDRAARARRGRPHDGHGLLARRQADHHGAAWRAADAALLGDDARRSGAARARNHARAEVRPGRPAQQAGDVDLAPGGDRRVARRRSIG